MSLIHRDDDASIRCGGGCYKHRVNYRRVLEIQTRLLGRVVSGEVHRYVGFETR